MEAIVLAGGFGTRLKQVVSDVPKPMAQVAGRPFLEILLSRLAQKNCCRVVLSLGHMANTIVNHFGNEFMGIELVYEIENTPLGTGGAVKQAMQHCQADHVFVFNGDTYLDLEMDQVERQWQQNKSTIIVGIAIDDTARYGRLLLDEGRISGFSEKGVAGPGLINAGCYLLPTTALDTFSPGQVFSLEVDYFSEIVDKQRLEVFVTQGYFIDIGVPEDFALAQVELADI